MYWRFQAENFFVTTIKEDCTLTPWVDWILPLLDIPSTIEDLKLFYVVFKIDDKTNRFTLPVYLETTAGWKVAKYKWYNVLQVHELKKYDTVWLNDLAENFNYLFKNIDDIWTIVKKWGLDILVYGWIVENWGISLTISDTTITLEDNTTSHIIFDFSDWTLKAVPTLAEFGMYHFADVITVWGEVTNIDLKKSFSVGEFFSTTYFTRNSDWAVIIKNWSITKQKMNFAWVTADDISEWEEHLLLTPAEREEIWKVQQKQNIIPDLPAIRAWAAAWATAVQPATLNGYQTKANMRTTMNNPDNEHYPTTKAVMDKLEEVWAWDMMKAVYDPNNKHTDAFNYENLDNTPTIPATAADVNALPDSTKYWATFELSLNTTTYVLTATLKDQDWTTLWTPQTVDLPIESVVVSWSYDSTNKKIVLTLESWQTIDIPVWDLVVWLQAEISVTNKLDADLVDDTNSTNKFVTATDISNWNWKWDMKYVDFNFVTKTWASVTLDLSSQITPNENFTINAPATIKDWQVYLLKVTNWATAYTMTLWSNIINPYNESVLLSPESTDIFMFLWTNNKLELLPETLTKLDVDKLSNVYYVQNSSDLITATSVIVDYLSSSIPPSVLYDWRIYLISSNHTSSNVWFVSIDDSANWWKLYWLEITFSYVNWNPTASNITLWNKDIWGAVKSNVAPSNPTQWDLWYDTTNNVLKIYNGTAWTTVWDTSNYLAKDNTTAFTPSWDYNPATKKYVDDNSAYVWSSAPSNPTAWKMWYDTTNNVLKTYNGSSWVAVWTESNTKTFYLTWTTGQTNLDIADEILQWYMAGKNPIVIYQDKAYNVDSFSMDWSWNEWLTFNHYTLETSPNSILIEYTIWINFSSISTPAVVSGITASSETVTTVISWDSWTTYILKSWTTKPAVWTTNNVLTIVLDS